MCWTGYEYFSKTIVAKGMESSEWVRKLRFFTVRTTEPDDLIELNIFESKETQEVWDSWVPERKRETKLI